MKFFIQNNELDKSVQEIRRKIRTLMNGVVADSIKDKGIVYKKNFGVDLPHLRDLARKYPPGHDLAQRLWALQIRETMILATLLEPADTFAESMAGEWMQSVNNIELVEQICMNLFSKLSYGSQLAIRLIHVDQKWSRITGFTLSARLWKDLDNEQVRELVHLAIENADTEDFYLYRAVSLSLCRLCRRDKATAEHIQNQTETFVNSDKLSHRYIAGEISNEISFLNF